jgi:outer membrane biosynthesis protein TonB
MPIPQVTDRIKEAPAVVLRAVFAGIGQLLMAVDKIRAQTQEHPASPAPAGQDGTGPAQSPPQPANGTGNVTQLRERPAPAATRPAAAQPAARTKPATTKPAATRPAAPKPAARTKPATTKPGAQPAATKPAAAQPAATKPAAAQPAAAQPTSTTPAAAPIPGYDDLSVPSLRARLRGLDADGVQALLDYEKAHARRDDVITMFERRLSKIGDEAS